MELSHIIALITCVQNVPELCQVLHLSETLSEAILDFTALAHEEALEMPNHGEGQGPKMGYSSHLI